MTQTPDPVEDEPFGADGLQLLERFRKFARGHVDDFKAARDRVRHLLAPAQPYLTGVAREDLLRQFLRRLLPTSIGVDSGVVYGFERVANSRQIDVLIWDALHHPTVFRGDSFVVLPPEAVIAAISVKTAAAKADYEDAVENLGSLVDLDIGFRETSGVKPIAMLALFYESPSSPANAQQWITAAIRAKFLARTDLHDRSRKILEQLDPVDPDMESKWFIERLLPRLFVHLEGDAPISFVRGWGPPNLTTDEASAQRLHRRPYLYRQRTAITTAFEKLAYHCLVECLETLGTQGASVASAWGDFHPQYHFRVGDAGELQEQSGTPIIHDTDL